MRVWHHCWKEGLLVSVRLVCFPRSWISQDATFCSSNITKNLLILGVGREEPRSLQITGIANWNMQYIISSHLIYLQCNKRSRLYSLGLERGLDNSWASRTILPFSHNRWWSCTSFFSSCFYSTDILLSCMIFLLCLFSYI